MEEGCMTLASLAELSKLHQTLIVKHRSGKARPSSQSLKAYVTALNCKLGREITVKDLLGDR